MTEFPERGNIELQIGQTVAEMPEFIQCAKGVLSDAERSALIGHLAANPTAGDLMEGTGGARKLRWGALGKGKRGGCRVITFYAGTDIPVFLLTVYAKGDKANLTKAERNELRAILTEIARRYREGR